MPLGRSISDAPSCERRSHPRATPSPPRTGSARRWKRDAARRRCAQSTPASAAPSRGSSAADRSPSPAGGEQSAPSGPVLLMVLVFAAPARIPVSRPYAISDTIAPACPDPKRPTSHQSAGLKNEAGRDGTRFLLVHCASSRCGRRSPTWRTENQNQGSPERATPSRPA